jgi:hypothetical protein
MHLLHLRSAVSIKIVDRVAGLVVIVPQINVARMLPAQVSNVT